MGQGSRVKLETGAYFAAAIALLILPLWFFLSLLIAASIHEFCHYMALEITGVKVFCVTAGPFGASMDTEAMSPGRELVCALAGPVGSLMLMPFFRWMPGIAMCGFIQGVFNLLPIYPMDGGRILKCLLEIMKIPHKERICRIIEWITVIGILVLGFLGKRTWNIGWGGVVIGAVLLLRITRRNTSCKESLFGVQ